MNHLNTNSLHPNSCDREALQTTGLPTATLQSSVDDTESQDAAYAVRVWNAATSVDSIRVQFECELHEQPPHGFRVISAEDKADKDVMRKRRNSVLWQEDGRNVWGRHAVAVGNGFVFHLRRFSASQPLTLSVWYSVPQWCLRHNCAAVGAADIERSIEALRSYCLTLGIETSRTAKVCEIHLMRNIVPPRPLKCYWPILWSVETPHSRHERNFATSIERGNKSTCWSIYDKAKQMQRNTQKYRYDEENGMVESDRLGKARVGNIENLLRFEYRLRRADKIKSVLGFSTVAELVADYGKLTQTMDRVLRAEIFNDRLPSPQELEAIQNYRRVQNGKTQRADIERYLTPNVCFEDALLAQSYERNLAEVAPEHLGAVIRGSYRRESAKKGAGNAGEGNGKVNLDKAEKARCARWSRTKVRIRQTRMRSLLEDGTPWAELYAELRDLALAPTLPN